MLNKFRSILIVALALCVYLLFGTPSTQAAGLPTVTIDPAYPTLPYGGSIPVKVTLGNVPWTGMHCVKIVFSVVNGGFAGSSIQSVSHVTSPTSVTFTVRAPSSGNVQGILSARVQYSEQYSCGGTLITLNAIPVTVSAATPWIVKVTINTLCTVDWGKPIVATIVAIDPWRYKSNIELKSPLVGALTVPPSPGTYTISTTWFCKKGFLLVPVTRQITVQITKTNQSYTFKD